MKVKAKPIVYEAVQWTEDEASEKEIVDFLDSAFLSMTFDGWYLDYIDYDGFEHTARCGDYFLKYENGFTHVPKEKFDGRFDIVA